MMPLVVLLGDEEEELVSLESSPPLSLVLLKNPAPPN